MTDRELMQQALDVLESSRVFVTSKEKIKHPEGTEWYDGQIAALRDRLAQSEQGPVAWEQFNEHMAGPFYKAPRELTNVEIHQQTIDALRGKVEKLKPKHPWIGLMDEPVAWMFQHEETGRTICVDAQQLEFGFEKGNPRLKKIAPLYTNPRRQWVGLTDEEIAEVEDEYIVDYRIPAGSAWNFAKDIEAKIRRKNQ